MWCECCEIEFHGNHRGSQKPCRFLVVRKTLDPYAVIGFRPVLVSFFPHCALNGHRRCGTQIE